MNRNDPARPAICCVSLFSTWHRLLLLVFSQLFTTVLMAQPPTITSFSPLAACEDGSITIVGTNLSQTTAVKIGGTPVISFQVNSTNSVTVVVGAGTSGKILLTTPAGTAESFLSLQITRKPTMEVVANKVLCHGDSTGDIIFQHTGNNNDWVTNNHSIGLPASSGYGNIPSFKAVNTTRVPMKADFWAAPLTFGYAIIACSNGVTFVNTETQKVEKQLLFASFLGGNGVAISPDRTKAYITMSTAGRLRVFSIVTKELLASIPVGISPAGVDVSADGKFVYVACANQVSVVNAATNTLVTTIPLSNGIGAKLNKPGDLLFVSDYNANAVNIVSTSNYSWYNPIPVGVRPYGLAYFAEANRLYVTNSGSSSVSVINTTSLTVVATIPVGMSPKALNISPDGRWLYVANSGSNTVSVINTENLSVTATVPVGANPNGVSVDPSGTNVYVTNGSSASISIISTASNSVVNTINSGCGGPSGLGNFISGITCYGKEARVFSITVNPAVNVTAPTNKVYCEGDIAPAISLASSADNTTYDISGGTAVGLADQKGVTMIPAFRTKKGTATIKITPKANGCTGPEVTYTITVKPKPVATISPSGTVPICPGTFVLLTASTGSGYTYQWLKNGGTIIQGGAASTLLTGEIGEYKVVATINGCSDTSLAVTVTAVDCSGNAIKTDSLPGKLCMGQFLAVHYQAIGTYVSGNVFSAQLSDGKGSFANPLLIGSITSTTSGAVPVAIPTTIPQDTSYRIRVVSNNPAIIGSDNGHGIKITAPPQASINSADLVTTYPNLPVTLTASPGGAYFYQWLFEGSAIAVNGKSRTYTAAKEGSYRVVVTTQDGCSDTSKPTVVQFRPCPEFIITVSSPNASEFTVHNLGGIPPYNYSLDSINFQAQNVFSGLTPGRDYTVYVRDSVNCVGSLTFTLRSPVDCNIQQDAGGRGTTIGTHNLGGRGGIVAVLYDMFDIPDQMDIYFNGSMVNTTKDLVSYKGWLTFRYTPPPGSANSCTIRMYAPRQGTAWEYTALCPIDSYTEMQNRKDTTCSTVFVSPGFPNGYPANITRVHTFTPRSRGAKLRADFRALLLIGGGQLNVYDGPSSSSPLITTLGGGYRYSENPSVVATNAAGQLTFQFSNGSTAGKYGWIADIYCTTYIHAFYPTTAKSGDTVTIAGNGFTGADLVSFGGFAASSFEVLSDSVIKAVVGNGQSGEVKVFSPVGLAALEGFVFTTEVDLCPNGDRTLYSNISGSSYQWQVNTGSGFVNVKDNANYTGSSARSLQLKKTPTSWYGYRYRCLVDGKTSSDILALRFVTYWQGSATNSNWELASNWNCGVVPDANTDVQVLYGKTIVNTDQVCRTLQVEPTAEVVIKAGVKLTVSGKK